MILLAHVIGEKTKYQIKYFPSLQLPGGKIIYMLFNTFTWSSSLVFLNDTSFIFSKVYFGLKISKRQIIFGQLSFLAEYNLQVKFGMNYQKGKILFQ